MPDLDDLQRAVREVADRATPPPFDTLVGRARARRRHRRLATAAAAVVVLAGSVAALLPRDDTAGVPPVVQRPSDFPTPSFHTDPPSPRERLAAWTPDQLVERGELASYGRNGTRTLTTWRACIDDQGTCRFGWRLLAADRVLATGAGPHSTDWPEVYPAGDGFVLHTRTGHGLMVHADGTTTAVQVGDPPRAVRAGDVVVATDTGTRVLDPATAESWTLAPPDGAYAVGRATALPDGTVWTLPGFAGPGRVDVAWLRDGTWHSHHVDDPTSDVEVPAMLAAGGGNVAALTSYDGAPVVPAGMLAISSDGGHSWQELGKPALPFHVVDSMAATADGTLFVAEPDGTLWRSSDGSWTRFAKVPDAGLVGGLEPAGTHVLARRPSSGPDLSDRLVLIADDGSTSPVAVR